jgi:hypothetical protein
MTASSDTFRRDVQVTIARRPADVQAYVLDGHHLPDWSFNTGAEPDGDGWRVTSELGAARLVFLDPTTPGVLDHDVTVAPGVVVHVPMRVRSEGEGEGSIVTITVLPGPDPTEESFAQDVALVREDLDRLRAVLES